ncbi:hypothetical protein C1H46_044501 [Malus baccata]|uniref:Uncharacterized protein n=1 Tax=Malus baccata TaxID=106549 RepID=A0A540K6W7_MALBA|nr:hypothetical protein C1H46_044501 [Malus baccata]
MPLPQLDLLSIVETRPSNSGASSSTFVNDNDVSLPLPSLSLGHTRIEKRINCLEADEEFPLTNRQGNRQNY